MCERVKRMKLHLSGLNFICQMFSQASSASRSFCNKMQSSIFFMTLKIRLSSANKRAKEYFRTSGRSLIYIRNKIGPSTVPCRTPEVTDVKSDAIPSITTRCVLFDKNALTQLSIGPVIP